MLNQQVYKMAAPGAGVIVFKKGNFPHGVEVLLAVRAKSVGQGFGVTGGGFADCDGLNNQPLLTTSFLVDEAFREMTEENLGFDHIIPLQIFRKRAQLLTTFLVRTPDPSAIHAVTYYGLLVTDAEFAKIGALKAGEERNGALQPARLSWQGAPTEGELPTAFAEKVHLPGKEQLFHQHEFFAFVALAQHCALQENAEK